ncbi:MAG: hypothetical protein LKE40_01595 [Spirochaetia bacterium]|jgi:ABC-type oligopeptide transport system ATPase subunit|nr:hypothetical protein [Spirochaetia bacterium]
MNRIFKYAFWKIGGTKVYALVGKSGTGKSFRSKMVAEEHNIDLIIDDGLLIKGNKVLAGRSAKQDNSFLAAVRTAVFDEPEHQKEVMAALQKERYHRILIIGTSEKMARRIADRLSLPQPEKIFHIEDIATKDEIDTAMRIRFTEGKHVIPVPSIEITRTAPQIVLDSMKVLFKGGNRLPWKKKMVFEKTVVRPEFTQTKKTIISDAALTQMVIHCLDEFDTAIKVVQVSSEIKDEGYSIFVKLRIPTRHMMGTTIGELQEYISESLEKYGSIFVCNVSVEMEEWG